MPADTMPWYDTVNGDAEDVVVQGVTVPGIFRSSSEVVLGEMVVLAPTLRLQASAVAAEGGLCTVRSQPYRIRQVQDLPPDGRERLLVLARGA